MVFVASEQELRTPADFARSGSARWEEHKLHLHKPAGEFSGAELDKISFKIHLSSIHGISPEDEIKTLWAMMENGEIFPLILAGKPITENSWLIESLSVENTYFDGEGKMLFATICVNLKEYDTEE